MILRQIQQVPLPVLASVMAKRESDVIIALNIACDKRLDCGR